MNVFDQGRTSDQIHTSRRLTDNAKQFDAAVPVEVALQSEPNMHLDGL